MKSKYKFTVGGRLGPGPDDAKEISMLNRIVRWTPWGIEYEADPCQVGKLLREIELEGANGAVTPGVKVLSDQVEAETDLPEKEFRRFRFLAARANYLAADRIDVLGQGGLQVNVTADRYGHGGAEAIGTLLAGETPHALRLRVSDC